MCSLVLFSLYSNDLLKYKSCIIKTCFQRGFELKNLIYKEKFHLKEKSVIVTKIKFVTKIKNHNQLYFGTLVLASYYYCGDNA